MEYIIRFGTVAADGGIADYYRQPITADEVRPLKDSIAKAISELDGIGFSFQEGNKFRFIGAELLANSVVTIDPDEEKPENNPDPH